ncbi:HAD-IB family hydrolase [Halieaceae bacterium IMCC14734]|uniref:1-acyl-sn-glycerol-3-phosphate acyltransferase n=1 Tax=Candidatus Litorirhabdus singularis TaxID=2518993 RepID=A0ABT3TBJ7_9GAMM|nr:HAD-IB family hydrolase [Candidatus Litorirhabdus singularis]MCX2979638.1 HAD-IB family hydrolase [Candidatus Litorirhabdus singularis]
MSAVKALVEHRQRLLALPDHGEPVVAFFDMDKTLILGHSIWALLREGVLSRRSDTVRMAVEFLAHYDRRGGGRNYSSVYKSFLGGIAGIEARELQELADKAFARSVAANIYREARELVALHQELGHKVVIVSAATQFQVAQVAQALGVDDFLCTRLEIRDDHLTGELVGPLCYGEGKVMAARKYSRRHGARLAQSWFYSDSYDDLPLLKQVGYPIATNPSEALLSVATQRGWPVLSFCSRGKGDLESLLRTALMGNTLLSAAAAGAAAWLFSRSGRSASNRMMVTLADLGAASAGLEFDVKGAEYLEAERPAIFTFNHQSYMDSVVLAHLLRHDVVPMVKQELASNPVLGPLLRAHGAIFVDRNANNQSACLVQAREVLDAGKSIVIAPEGTRSATGELLEFKHGAFYLARKMRVPLIPVVLHNVADTLPKGGLLLRSATINVSILPPVQFSELGDIRLAAVRLHAAYERELAALWAHPLAAGGVAESAKHAEVERGRFA